MQLNFIKILIIFFVIALIGAGGFYLIKEKQKVKQEQFPDLESTFTEDKDIVPPEDTIPTEEEFVKLSKEEQAECLKNTETMTDDELIATIKNIRNPWGIVEEVNKDRKTYAQKQLFRHFICRLEREKDEELYKKTKEFVQGWDNVSEEGKEIELDWLEEVYKRAGSTDKNPLYVTVAFADMDELCSEEFTEFCYRRARQRIIDASEPWLCDNACEKIEKLLNDEEYYNSIVLDLVDPVTNEFQFISFPDISNIKGWRIALAYRKGGEEEVYQICNNLVSDKQGECNEFVNGMILPLKKYENCNNYPDNIKNEICEY